MGKEYISEKYHNMKMKPILLLAFLLISSTLMAQITISFEGSKQGKFKGESQRKGFEDKSEILGYISELNSPRDPASGLATGRRSYLPIVILKACGAASPMLMQAAANNEVIKKIVIDFYKRDMNGMEINYYTVTLENASISGFKQFVGPLDNERFNPEDRTLYDEIRIVFQKITVEEKTGKTMATDDANGRN